MKPNRKTASILSVVAMGLGQIYNRQYIKGILMLLLHGCGLYFVIFNLKDALWGIITLGEKAQHLELVGKVYKMVPGDHSIFLIVQALIVLFGLIVFICAYIANIKDAYKVGKSLEEGIKPHHFIESVRYVNQHRFPQLIISVPLLFVLFFTILPLVFSVMIAFTNYSSPKYLPPANLIDWIGFDAFKQLFTLNKWANTFYGVLKWNIIWAVVATVSTFFGGFGVALLVQSTRTRFKSLWRTIYILPFAIPSFVSYLIMRNMFNSQFGPINQYLKWIGIQGPSWLSDPTWAKVTVLLVNLWHGYPISMLLIIGILTTISKELYQAADVDGASAFQKFRMITFPSVMFSLSPILIGMFAGNVNSFSAIFLLTNGNPANSEYQFAGNTDILITWLYNLTMNQGNYNFASVIGIIIFIILATLSIWNVRRTRSFKEEEIN